MWRIGYEPEDYITPTTKEGYYTYTNGKGTAWVKIPKQAMTNPRADINEDGTVNAADLSILLGNFGRTR